ncbi:MAG: sulfur carrier protein ThiS [Acidobacteriota bacterium]|nr:sulfur carrier protein ThiS [Acidobacteriota bacterium]
MDVFVNGDPLRLEGPRTVAEVVAGYCPSPDGIAVARNREVVPRSTWDETALEPGDRIEIVTAAAGG